MLKERKMFPMIIILILGVVLFGGFCLFKGRRYQTADYAGGFGSLQSGDSRTDVFGVEMERHSGATEYVEGEVVFNAESREEAERVADAVNGQLKSWQDGIAVISIEGTVDEFLKKYSGAPDLPTMYPNYIYSVN